MDRSANYGRHQKSYGINSVITPIQRKIHTGKDVFGGTVQTVKISQIFLE